MHSTVGFCKTESKSPAIDHIGVHVSLSDSTEHVAQWMAALETRHLADLRFAEVTRALRALSSAYVERRHKVASGSALDSAGKRAAFALYYGPLHFIATQHVGEGVIGRSACTRNGPWLRHRHGGRGLGADRSGRRRP